MSKGDQAKQDERAAEKAAREAAWWAQWREQDFSWDGLAALDYNGEPKHRWIGWSVSPDGRCVETADAPDGSRPATLQDYFRRDVEAGEQWSDDDLRDAGLLVEDTRQAEFHILHLPETHADSSASFKVDLEAAEWDVLEAEIGRRLDESGATVKAVDGYTIEGADYRAQFTGAILRRFPRPKVSAKDEQALPQLHLSADLCACLGDANASSIEFGSPFSMETALFKEGANFSRAQFSGGDANFWNAQFSGRYVDFSGAQFSSGEASFGEAQFSGEYTIFSYAEFSDGDASFHYAQFSGGGAYFHRAQFSGGEASFGDAQFSGGEVSFGRAQFTGGGADFEEAQFSGGNANFHKAKFGLQRMLARDLGLPSETSDWLPNTIGARFQNAEFKHGALFLGARFHGEAGFRGARFGQACEFGRADQHGSLATAIQPGAQFDKRLSLRGASFKGLADFSRVRFPQRAEDRNSAFEGARFFEPLDFKGVATLPFSAFHGIRLDQGILLDSDHPDPGQFDDALKAAEEAAVRDAAFATAKNPDPDFERRGRDKRFAALEAGCRALKTAMAEENDRAREQVFYTFELRAREHRFDRSAVSDQQRPLSLAGYRFSRLYGAVANYGTSVSRPLIRLGWLTLGFAALNLLILAVAMLSGSVAAENWVWWAPDAPIHPSLTDTLGLAFKNALGPLRILAGNGEAFDHLGDRAPIFTGLMLVSTLIQGLASSALIFLSLLALRRQFQIN